MKIAAIIGARPQFIKAAAISRAIAGHNRNNLLPVIEEILVHTGQYYEAKIPTAIYYPKGDHEIWYSPLTKLRFPVDGKIRSRHTANGVLKQAGLPKQF